MAEKDFDSWFADSFPEYVYAHGKRFLDPYYSIAQAAYYKGLEDGMCDMTEGGRDDRL